MEGDLEKICLVLGKHGVSSWEGHQNQILDRYLVYWYNVVPLLPSPLCHDCS